MVTSSEETTGALLGLSNDLAGAVERAGASIVGVHARRHSASSGLHWRDGIVVTADHTLERDEGITVTLPDGSSRPATIAGRDSGTDLAILRVEGLAIPTAQSASPDELRIGHIVLAVARPGEHGLSASWGAISALSGPWRTWSGGQIDRLIRPDLTLYPGFSGGALVDARGAVIGINTSGLSRHMTLTIPASTVDRVVEQLQTRGRVARGYLGVAMQQVRLPDALVSQLELPDHHGLIVVSIENGGPAERGGMFVGDVLVQLGGKPVNNTDSVQSLLDPSQVGSTVSVRVLRGGQPADLSVVVGERPQKGA